MALTAHIKRLLAIALANTGEGNALATAIDAKGDTTGANTWTGNQTFANLIIESNADALTAFAGGGQASALALTKEVNRVTTVTTAGDSVKLPVSVAGMTIAIINSGANPMQVFGAGTDTINGVAAATGISQPPNSVDIYVCPLAGVWFVETGVGFAGSLFTESTKDAITAFAGGGQASATALTAQMNRVTTVASAGDSVKLPASAAGLTIVVINNGTSGLAMQVFGTGTDTINGVAAATGVSQQPSSVAVYYCPLAGLWQSEGLGTGYNGSLQTLPASSGLTAHAGGGQGSALALTASINRISTVATAGDSVALPASAAGMQITVVNNGANAMQVFGAGTDTINGVATATGVSQMANSVVVYSCPAAGIWQAEGLGTGYSGSLQTLPSVTTLTAHAGGGQGSALALTASINRVTTVATPGDSVALPAAVAGMQITIVNTSTNAMQVYGAGTDTINFVATATGVSQMPSSVVVYTCTFAGQWQAEGLGQGYSGSFPTTSTSNGLTAHAGGGQASALLLTATINRVTTVGSAADSVLMPVSAPGMSITVTNAAGVNSMNVFPQTGDQINALGANAAFAIAAGKTANLTCAVAGQWHAVLSA